MSHTLRDLIEKKAFIPQAEGRYIRTSEKVAAWAFNLKPLILSADSLSTVCDAMWEQLQNEPSFQVAGLETAAIPLITGMVLKGKKEGEHKMSGFYIRKSRRKDGFQTMVEGDISEKPIILVDDILNTGKSLLRQVEALRSIGKKVHAVCVIIRFREPSFYAFFEEQGIKIFSLFTLDDFPQSGGVQSFALAQSRKPLHEAYDVKWKFESENPSYLYVVPKSAPAIDDKRLYVGSDSGVFWALNQSDGSVAWTHRTLFGAGQKRIFSSPALSLKQKIVYFGAYDGNLYALDSETGAKKWMYREADWVGSSPAVAEEINTVFVGLEFGLWKKQGGIAALDAQTGKKKWWSTFETLAHSSPAYSSTRSLVVIGSSGGTVYAFDATDGTERWKYETDGAVRASFAIDEERGVVCFGSEDGHIYICDLTNGTLMRKIQTMEPVYATPIIHAGKLYCGLLDKRIVCISLESGEMLWEYWSTARVFSTPVIIDESLYIGSNDGRLYELDPNTGAEVSIFQVSERIVNKIAYNPADETIFLPTYANEIYCLKKKTSGHPSKTA